MITVYNSNETSFISDGLGVIDPIVIDSDITNELNAAYYSSLTVAIDEKNRFDLLQHDRIVKMGGQLFRIMDLEKTDAEITVLMLHIFYDLNNNFFEDVAPTDKNGNDALQWLFARTQYPTPFTVSSDIADIHTARYVRRNVTDAIMGDLNNSFLKLWGGELRRNNYSLEINSRIGQDTGIEISYGKNITGIIEKLDRKEVFTRVMPQGFDGLLLPEKYVDSPIIGAYPWPIVRKIEFPDIKVNNDPAMGDIVTEAQAHDQLRAAAQKLFTEGKADIPKVNYSVNFIDLAQTEEYKKYAVLEKVELGDTVMIRHDRLKIEIMARVIKTVYDPMNDRYKYIELGNFGQNINSYIKQVTTSLQAIQDEKYLKAIESASELIRAGFGGYVVKTRDEILIMDTDDTATAQHVWRWNINGLGYSNTGYNGTYGLAMTMDGKINADFIKAGKLLAQYIEAETLSSITAALGEVTTGVIRSIDNTLRIDLNNKTFSVGSGTESVHTDLQYNGMQVKGGAELIAAFGESGAIIPTAEIGAIYNEFVIQRRYSATVSVGTGGTYSSVAQALNALFPNGTRFIWGTVTLNLVSSLSEDITLDNLFSGTLVLNLSDKVVNGKINVYNSTSRIVVSGVQYNHATISGTSPITVSNSRSVYMYYLNVDAKGGTRGAFVTDGGRLHLAVVDIANCTYAGFASADAELIYRVCRGNATYSGRAESGGTIKATNSVPNGSSGKYSISDGFVIENGSPLEADSLFVIPPVTSQEFKQVFTGGTFDTLVHGTSSIDSYYGASAAQNRWDSSMGWVDGRIRLGAEVYNFFNGGTGISIRMRLRRKNTTHGSSGAVYPAPYNHSASYPSGALRGGWTGWATVSSSLFTAGGATLTYYNGVSGSAGYAIWDRIEIEVTVTKNV